MPPSIAEVTAALTAPGAPFETEEVTVRGVAVRAWKNAPPTLRTVLEQSRGYGGATFLVYEDDRTTFDEHFRQVATLAHRLQERYGVRPGDRVAIAMRNYPEWSVAFWAATAAGAVVVPLNAWWTAPELEYGLGDSGTTVAFVDAERLERLAAVLPGLGLAGRTVVAKPAAGGADPATGAGLAEAFADVLGTPDADALPDVDLSPEDDATIFYTSGTTGRPKGVLGTQRNICTNLLSVLYGASRTALRAGQALPPPGGDPGAPQSAYLLSVPFFHATGCHSVLVPNTALGGKLVIMHKWDPERALELIERERVTTFGGVPSMAWQVLDSPSFATRDLSSVQSVSYGGAPAPPELVRRIEKHFPGRTPGQGWGLTETSSVTTYNSGPDYVAHPDSVGVPVAVCDVKAVDESGADLPRGGVGELWVKGPNVVKGYWAKPEETDRTFTDGWLHTGDVGRVDEEGFVYLLDRAKDLIIRGGENVSSPEVEAALFEHPDVADAAAVGIPHQVLGEEVGAVVVRRAGSAVTEDELRRHVGARLAAFKVPSHVWFRDEPLPRNPAGKVLKRELRQELLEPPVQA